MLRSWTGNRLSTTPLRETLDRQSGMYRIAAKISDKQIDDVVGNFCKIRWRLSADDSVEARYARRNSIDKLTTKEI